MKISPLPPKKQQQQQHRHERSAAAALILLKCFVVLSHAAILDRLYTPRFRSVVRFISIISEIKVFLAR